MGTVSASSKQSGGPNGSRWNPMALIFENTTFTEYIRFSHVSIIHLKEAILSLIAWFTINGFRFIVKDSPCIHPQLTADRSRRCCKYIFSIAHYSCNGKLINWQFNVLGIPDVSVPLCYFLYSVQGFAQRYITFILKS